MAMELDPEVQLNIAVKGFVTYSSNSRDGLEDAVMVDRRLDCVTSAVRRLLVASPFNLDALTQAAAVLYKPTSGPRVEARSRALTSFLAGITQPGFLRADTDFLDSESTQLVQAAVNDSNDFDQHFETVARGYARFYTSSTPENYNCAVLRFLNATTELEFAHSMGRAKTLYDSSKNQQLLSGLGSVLTSFSATNH